MNIFYKLSFVKKQHEGSDVYTFFFTRPRNIQHKAGQHGVFLLPGLYRPHPFSLASAPDEEYIAFSTHTASGSRYKRRLSELKEGNSIGLMGPALNFTFKKEVKRHVLLAQGIGITPFRSMLMHAETHLPDVETTLVHVDSGEHLFRDITEPRATKTFYPMNSDAFRDVVTGLDTEQQFYISGSPKFVFATKKLLLETGVKAPAITTDSFLGY